MIDTALAPSWRLDHSRTHSLAEAALADPFAILGPHRLGDGAIVRAFLPGATGVEVVRRSDGSTLGALDRGECDGLFEGPIAEFTPYRLRIAWPGGVQETEDPYAFGLLLGDLDLHLFNEGRHFNLADEFGAQVKSVEGVTGVRFAVWAPNARRVAVVADFNSWDASRHRTAHRRRGALQVRHRRTAWQSLAAQGRSRGAASGTCAGHSLDRRGTG
jgi:1,4-alpha-glucan branching enzyme